MLIQGCSNKKRREILVNKYSDLIKAGVLPKEILVILLNPYKKNIYINDLKNVGIILDNKAKIYTLNGLYYNAFKENESYIKNIINCEDSEAINLCGLEVSQYIFKQSIKEADFSDYISKVNLLHQLFRRYSLIVQNALTDSEVKERSEILNEVFAKDAYRAIKDYKQKTIEYRSFDYLRQAAIFPVIYKNTEYFSNIKYVIVDDADEMPYMFWQFLDYIMPSIFDYVIAYDEKGSSRCGYLCAYKNGVLEFKDKYNPKETFVSENLTFQKNADSLYDVIKKSEKIKAFDNIGLYKNFINRLEMLECIFSQVKQLTDSGVSPHEIAVITPSDITVAEKSANSFGLRVQSLTGSEKLCDIKGIKHILSVLKIVNEMPINEFEVKSLFVNLLKIPYKRCRNIIKDLNKIGFKEYCFEEDIYNEKYKKVVSVVNSLKKTNYKLSEQVRIIYENLIKDYIYNDNKQKYDFLLKEALSFELAFGDRIKDFVQEFVIQMENSVISENPANSFELKANEVIISSAQKLIDYSIETKYQFWADVSASGWVKQDTGTLYNAWVFNRDWQKKEYTLCDNIALTNDKTARMVRKLMLLANKEIRFFSSIYDGEGNENFGGLTEFISFPQEKKKAFKIVPREDQKPVLDYRNGKLGVMAVPGAGKTTILLALIIKLIKSGINPENIFVLTYMESAAKNFKERIKDSIENESVLPNISTIHGLALRIIKENGNYIKVGLDENFDICDDSEKERIIRELFYKLGINEDKYDNYLRCISVVKPLDYKEKLHSKYKEIQEFYNFLDEYNKTLKERNLIDYDDMLRFALRILNENEEIREYYQGICKYIIEDEAQDSTRVQQSLISILSAKYNNIVRCGDINQSITSTFTNSNLESFRGFIAKNNKVEMSSSQRCAEQIYTLANKMIDASFYDDNKNGAFYKIEMQGTANNPKSDIAPSYKIFENEKEEQEYILNKIKEIIKKEPQASIAILLRLNADVVKYNEYMTSNGLRTAIRTDAFAQKEIYKFIYVLLCIINSPDNNKNIIDLMELYIRRNKLKSENNSEKEFVEKLKIPFIEIDPDEIQSELLLQLYWDIDYWLNKSDKDVVELALDIGLYYSQNSVEQSNTYLIATFIKKLKANNKGNELLKLMEYYAQRPANGYKFFDDNNSDDYSGVSIMTMHKSKGDEFDYVFIPQLNDDMYSIEQENVKLKNGSHFVETVRSSIQKCDIKTPIMLKRDQTDETLRLLYVGITRAKYGLFLSSAQKYLIRKNVRFSKFINSLFDN